jgi:alkylation response protein AidB-like acyl-CoA dehydrogenase
VKLTLTTQERELQAEVRTFLREALAPFTMLPPALDERIELLRGWQSLCHAAGFVGRAWPEQFGGGGRPPVEQIIVDQELAAAGAPEFVGIVGLDVLGPSLLRFGSDDQRARYIPPILSADEIWCQGFSEPEAGSDLASLRTRAIETDDSFVISGQKTWVSWGHYARWCGVLARTDETVARHKGISMLIVDMTSPGIEVCPMTQITGHAEFSELFFDDVVVPKQNLLSERGDGWAIAMYTLGHERGTAALPRQVKLRTWVDRAVREAAASGALDDPVTQVELARALVSVEILRHHAYRTVGEFLGGGAVGPESSSVKLLMAEAEQRIAATGFDVLGDDDFWTETYLYSRAASVYGGTQQIQRSIIADRILSLPKD